MSYAVIGLVALVASGLTLFSGFGLGTLLLPAFALFVPIEVAVWATALVHLANNFFKLVLVGSKANARAVVVFGLPAIPGAMIGAGLLVRLAGVEPLTRYELFGRACTVTGAELVVAVLIGGFALLELTPARERMVFGPRLLPVGGLLSGLFGGLSGHQGALRSAFLIRTGMSKEAFIGTGVVCAVLVDLSRIAVYGSTLSMREAPAAGADAGALVTGMLAAFCGAWIGARLLGKVTLDFVRRTVGVLLLVLALALGSGIL